MQALWMSVVLGGLASCSSLPRVVVLHDPLTAQEHVTLGLTYEGRGHAELAAQEYQAALEKDPHYLPAFLGLGNLAFARGALEEAEAYYRQALAVAFRDPGANNNLAMVYLARGGGLEEAEQLVKRALAQEGPLRPYALDTMARIYIREGRYREAVAALNEAEAISPSSNTVLQEQLAQTRRELAGVFSRME